MWGAGLVMAGQGRPSFLRAFSSGNSEVMIQCLAQRGFPKYIIWMSLERHFGYLQVVNRHPPFLESKQVLIRLNR